MRFCYFFFLALILPTLHLWANNLQIKNVEIVDNQKVSFTLRWENAWKDSIGHDAVWCFAKIQMLNETAYKHLKWQNTKQNLGKVSVEVSTDANGFFVKTLENGDFIEQKVSLNLAEKLPTNVLKFLILGIEMVYVREGAFWIGDGVNAQNAFRQGIFAKDTTKNLPFFIESEAEISVGEGENQLYGGVESLFFPQKNIPQKYPKGFNAFYLMKYEISQAQYLCFLNTLSREQQKNHIEQSVFSPRGTFVMSPNPNFISRNGIVISTVADANPAVFALDGNENGIFNESDDGADRACNYLSSYDLAAYLDWAALRPMTEFEFEKACRGAFKPKKGEMSWGTTDVIDANNLLNEGKKNENVTQKASANAGLASYNSGISTTQIMGGLRCGFGGSAESNRLQSGSAYFGAKEMSGNLWEQCVTISAEALFFEAIHGDGQLDADGFSEVWRSPETLFRLRGGAWNSFVYEIDSFRDLAISARYYADKKFNNRINTLGGRGARSDN